MPSPTHPTPDPPTSNSSRWNASPAKRAAHTDAAPRLAAANTAYDSLDTQRHDLDQELGAARADALTLTDRITQLTQIADGLETAGSRASAAARTGEEHRQADAAATEAARTAGFESADAASQALLPDEKLHALDDEITQWRQQRAMLTARLEEPDLQAAAAQPPADFDEAVAQLDAATSRHTRTATLAGQAADRTRTLADLNTRLDALIQRLQPLEHAYRTVDHRRRVDKHAKLLADTGDLGREPVYQELRRSVQPMHTNTPTPQPGWKGLKICLEPRRVWTVQAK
ncbi:hypothetical protein [Streptomyces sp. NPDC050564]|uniref:hypothetical protein n=1 Tax=Streptomyces sp. NPDC050564 TaxID=3365631 RepID=UPI0037B356A3